MKKLATILCSFLVISALQSGLLEIKNNMNDRLNLTTVLSYVQYIGGKRQNYEKQMRIIILPQRSTSIVLEAPYQTLTMYAGPLEFQEVITPNHTGENVKSQVPITPRIYFRTRCGISHLPIAYDHAKNYSAIISTLKSRTANLWIADIAEKE